MTRRNGAIEHHVRSRTLSFLILNCPFSSVKPTSLIEVVSIRSFSHLCAHFSYSTVYSLLCPLRAKQTQTYKSGIMIFTVFECNLLQILFGCEAYHMGNTCAPFKISG